MYNLIRSTTINLINCFTQIFRNRIQQKFLEKKCCILQVLKQNRKATNLMNKLLFDWNKFLYQLSNLHRSKISNWNRMIFHSCYPSTKSSRMCWCTSCPWPAVKLVSIKQTKLLDCNEQDETNRVDSSRHGKHVVITLLIQSWKRCTGR